MNELTKVIAETLGENLNYAHIGYDIDLNEIAADIAKKVLSVQEQKTGWEKAPPWAKWKTIDADGAITFWEFKPKKGHSAWVLSDEKGQYICMLGENAHWDNTLEERPK